MAADTAGVLWGEAVGRPVLTVADEAGDAPALGTIAEPAAAESKTSVPPAPTVRLPPSANAVALVTRTVPPEPVIPPLHVLAPLSTTAPWPSNVNARPAPLTPPEKFNVLQAAALTARSLSNSTGAANIELPPATVT